MNSFLLRQGRSQRAQRWWTASLLAAAIGAVGCGADGQLDDMDVEGEGPRLGEQRVLLDSGVALGSTDAANPGSGDTGSDAGAPIARSSFPTAEPGRAGPYETETQRNVGPQGAFTLVLPRGIASSQRQHPIITWGNGTGASPASYTSMLNRLASHGFVVIASNSPNTGSANEMIQGIDWVLAQNNTPGNALYQKLDPARIGATGHSQGGFGTCAATRDPRIKTIVPIQGFRAPARTYQGSIFAISGDQDTIVSPDGIESGFDRLTTGPAMLGELSSATHTNWMRGTGEAGAETNEAVVAWMRVHLMDDTALRLRFYGASCGYCSDPEWRVKQKAMQ